MKKRILSGLLALVMLLSMFPTSAFAVDAVPEDGLFLMDEGTDVVDLKQLQTGSINGNIVPTYTWLYDGFIYVAISCAKNVSIGELRINDTVVEDYTLLEEETALSLYMGETEAYKFPAEKNCRWLIGAAVPAADNGPLTLGFRDANDSPAWSLDDESYTIYGALTVSHQYGDETLLDEDQSESAVLGGLAEGERELLAQPTEDYLYDSVVVTANGEELAADAYEVAEDGAVTLLVTGELRMQQIEVLYLYTADESSDDTFTVVYTDGEANGGAFEAQTYEVAANEATTAFEGEPERAGYRFDGWLPKVAETVTEDVTYEAQWKQIQTAPVYLAIYRNGDTSKVYKSVKVADVEKGTEFDLSQLPELLAETYTNANGYEWDGFYNDGWWKLGGTVKVNGWTNIKVKVTDYQKVLVYGTIGVDKGTQWKIFSGKALHGTNLLEFLESQELDLEKTDYIHDEWYNYDYTVQKFNESKTITGWTNVMVQYTHLENVQLVIYRNGNTETPYKVVPLPKMVKGDVLDVSALDISDYYGEEAKNGFQFEGWYNDGGWNYYRQGDASKVLPEEITIQGWTNISCMVKDQYPVYAYVYADGDLKTPVVKEFLGFYPYGTSYASILEKHGLLNSIDTIFTPKNEKNGYEWDQKWWHEISNYGKPWGEIGERTVSGHTNLCAVVNNKYPVYAYVYTNGATDVKKYAAEEFLGCYAYGTSYAEILEEHGYLTSLDGLYTAKNEKAGYEWDQKWWHELSNYGKPWGEIGERTVIGHTNLCAMVYEKYPAYAMVYTNGSTKEPAVKEFLGYYAYGTSYTSILEDHGYLTSLDGLYTAKNQQAGYEWDQKWWHEISNYGKPWGEIGERTVNGHTNLCAMVYDKYPAYAMVYANGNTKTEVAKEFLGYYAYGTPYTSILEEHGYLTSLDGLYDQKNGYEWDQKWWHEISNYGKPWGEIGERTVIGHTNLCAMVYNKYPVYAYVYANGNTKDAVVKEFLGYYTYGTSFASILEEHGCLDTLDQLYKPQSEKPGYEWDGIWSHEVSNLGKPIGERTVSGWTNLCTMIYLNYPVYAKVYHDGDTSKPANSEFLGYYAYGTTFASILEDHGYLDSLEGLYLPNADAVRYDWDGIWSHEVSNLGKPIGDKKVSGWTNLCTMVYDVYPVRYHIDGEDVYSDTFTVKDLETYTFYTAEEREGYTFDGWYESEADIGQEDKRAALPLTLKAYDLYGTYNEIELTIQFWLTENATWINEALAADKATVMTLKPSEAKYAVSATAVLSDPNRAFVSWNTEDGTYDLWGGEAINYFEINDYADENNVINLYASFEEVDVMLETITVNFHLTHDATWTDGTTDVKSFTLTAGNSNAVSPAATALFSAPNLAFTEWAGKDGEPTVDGKATFSYWTMAQYADENGILDLYAQFEEVEVMLETITVNFHLTHDATWTDGTTDVKSFTLTVGNSSAVAPAATALFSAPNLAFTEWADKDGEPTVDGKAAFSYWTMAQYADENGVIDLYAQFEEVEVMLETITVNFHLTHDATWIDGTTGVKSYTLTAGNSNAVAPAATALISAPNLAFTEWAGKDGEPTVDGKATFSYWTMAQYADENGVLNLYAQFEEVKVMLETITVNFWLTNNATWADGTTAADAAKSFTLTAGNSNAVAPAATAVLSAPNLAFTEWAGKDGEPTVDGKAIFSYWNMSQYADENGVIDLYAQFEEVEVMLETITVNFWLTNNAAWADRATAANAAKSFTLTAGNSNAVAPAATAVLSAPNLAFTEWASKDGKVTLDGKAAFSYWTMSQYADENGVINLYAQFEEVEVMRETITVNFWLTNNATWADGTDASKAKSFTLTAGNSNAVAPAATAVLSASNLAFTQWASKDGKATVDGKNVFSYWTMSQYADENGVIDLYAQFEEVGVMLETITVNFWLTNNAAWADGTDAAKAKTYTLTAGNSNAVAPAATAVLSAPNHAFIEWASKDGKATVDGKGAFSYWTLSQYADENGVVDLYAQFDQVEIMHETLTVNFWLTKNAAWTDGTAADQAKTYTLIAGNSNAVSPAATAVLSASSLAFVEWAAKNGEPTLDGKAVFSYWSLAPYADKNGVVDLYAVFEEVTVVPDTPITVNFHLTEGEWAAGGNDVISFTMVAGFQRFTAPAATAILSDSTRAFDEWASKNGLALDGKEEFNYWTVCDYAVDGVVDLYSVFREVPNTYHVVFEEGKHGELNGKTEYWLQEGEGVPAVPAVDADWLYTFIGWRCDVDGNRYSTREVMKMKFYQDTVFTAEYMLVLIPGGPDDHVPSMLNGDDHYAYINGYTDGTVKPEGSILRSEVAAMFFRLLDEDTRSYYLTKTNGFSDVKKDDWFNIAVSTMVKLGVITGYTDGTFRPNEPITRAEFAAICARFSDEYTTRSCTFTDIPRNFWAEDEIALAEYLGWINGYTDGTFRPNQTITRAEAMAMVNRVLNRNPEDTDDLLYNMTKWPDNRDVNKWYYLDVQEATNSHDYKRKNNGHEYWTELNRDPDWQKYE